MWTATVQGLNEEGKIHKLTDKSKQKYLWSPEDSRKGTGKIAGMHVQIVVQVQVQVSEAGTQRHKAAKTIWQGMSRNGPDKYCKVDEGKWKHDQVMGQVGESECIWWTDGA